MNKYLEKLHEELVDIMDNIHKVCIENGIKYYLVGGSLLGAIRHKGFIPWDDDFDIGMPRKDFDVFVKMSEKKLPPNLKLFWTTTYENYWYPFAKIYNNRTLFVEKDYENVPKKTGIYVDIFPLDTVEDYGRLVETRKKKTALITRIMRDKILGIKPKGFKKRILHIISSTKSIKQWHSKQTKIMTKSNNRGTMCANYASYYSIKKQVMPWSFYGEGVCVNFEGRKYIAPTKFEEVLKSIYGSDYMELPPVEKRRTHYPSYIQFKDNTVFKEKDFYEK